MDRHMFIVLHRYVWIGLSIWGGGVFLDRERKVKVYPQIPKIKLEL